MELKDRLKSNLDLYLLAADGMIKAIVESKPTVLSLGPVVEEMNKELPLVNFYGDNELKKKFMNLYNKYKILEEMFNNMTEKL